MWKFKISKRNDDSSRKLALEGNCVLTPVYPISENLEKTEKQLGKLKEANFKRCSLSFIANVNFNLLLLKLPSANKNPTQYQASKVFSSSLLISPQCCAFCLAAQLRHIELDLLALYQAE